MNRRSFIQYTIAGSVLALSGRSGVLHAAEKPFSDTLAAAFSKRTEPDVVGTLFGDVRAQPSEQIHLELPLQGRFGQAVPVTVKYDGADARTIAIVTAENPQPLNGFVRLSGARGFLSTRLRIRQSSLVSAYVRTSDGLYMTSQRIKIGYGGYGMLHEEPRPAVDTDTPLHVVTRMRVRRQDGHSEVLVLVNHPMGMSGGVPAGSGAAQPAHLIELMAIERNGRTVAEIHMGPGIAPNPLTGILLDITRIGDRISARWVDSEGLSGGAEQRIT